MERGSYLYAADGVLSVRPSGGHVHTALGNEWREAAIALNSSLDNPTIPELLPLYQSALLLPPEDR